MFWFNKDGRPKSKRKSSSDPVKKAEVRKQVSKIDQEIEEQRQAHVDLLKMSEEEPEVRRARIEKVYGLRLKPYEPKSFEDKMLEEALENDPEYIEQLKQAKLDSLRGGRGGFSNEIEDAIESAVAAEIQSDPELIKKLARQRLAAITTTSTPLGAAGDLIEQMRAYKMLEEEMGGGGKKGLSDFLVELGNAFAPYIPALLLRQAPLTQLTGPRIETLPPPQVPLQAKPVTQEVPLESVEEVVTQRTATLDIAELEEILEMEPFDFATQLIEKAKEDSNSKILLTILTTTTADDFIKLLEPHKDNEKVKPILEKLVDEKKAWLEEVIELLKSLKEPEV